MSTFKDVINGVKDNAISTGKQYLQTTADSVTTGLTAAQLLQRNFITTKDFYNFIKTNSGMNSPTDFFYFSVNFYAHNENLSNSTNMDKTSMLNDDFFESNAFHFSRFRFCIQGISFPEISIRGVNTTGRISF